MSTGLALREGRHHCPAHDDHSPSLSIRRGADGRILVHCFAGCRPEAILEAAGLAWRDLYPEAAPRLTRRHRRSWRDELLAPLLARERRVQARLEPYLPVFAISDYIRTSRQQIAHGRALASSTIGDVEHVWSVLDQLAARERFVSAIEAELDDVVRWLR